MKKLASQISVALVCCILGFMIAYQFKMLNKQQLEQGKKQASADVTVEVEEYKNAKEQLEKKVNELQNKVKEYEDSAVKTGNLAETVRKELENSRILTGSTDVQGPGITAYITPKSGIFTTNIDVQPINDHDLVDIVNELNAAGAEAISINDIRLTSRTGIRNAGNAIIINEIKISPYKPVMIKAIGDKNLLNSALSFPGAIPDFPCDVKWDKSDSIKVFKYTKPYKFEYAKPMNEK